jgi:hypothetical protein
MRLRTTIEAKIMKKILVVLTLLLTYGLANEDAKQEAVKPNAQIPKLWPDVLVSKIDLTTKHTVNDAVKQIIAGLPPEGRVALVVEVPESELAAMPLKSDLSLRNVPIGIALGYLEHVSTVGFKLRDNAWHVGSKRQDDIVAAEYMITKEALEKLGVVVGPNQTFTTRKQRMWPPESYWQASFHLLENEEKGEDVEDVEDIFEPKDMGVLRVLAARSYQEEISAVLLLWSRGYGGISLDLESVPKE